MTDQDKAIDELASIICIAHNHQQGGDECEVDYTKAGAFFKDWVNPLIEQARSEGWRDGFSA